MPILAALLVTLFTGLAGFLAQYVTKKMAIGLALVAVLATITVALLLAMRALIAGIAPTIGSGNISIGLSIAIPSNASACITAVIACWTMCTIYTWKKKALTLFAQA
jgi:hypothetical protein